MNEVLTTLTLIEFAEAYWPYLAGAVLALVYIVIVIARAARNSGIDIGAEMTLDHVRGMSRREFQSFKQQ